MEKILVLAGGGAIGTILRYFASSGMLRITSSSLPWGTIFVNLLGSFLIGLCWGIFESRNISPQIRLFLFVGIFGSFTTFSTFSLENMNLLRTGEFFSAFSNILIQNILALALVFLGFAFSRFLLK